MVGRNRDLLVWKDRNSEVPVILPPRDAHRRPTGAAIDLWSALDALSPRERTVFVLTMTPDRSIMPYMNTATRDRQQQRQRRQDAPGRSVFSVC